jgi:hypothetical protein
MQRNQDKSLEAVSTKWIELLSHGRVAAKGTRTQHSGSLAMQKKYRRPKRETRIGGNFKRPAIVPGAHSLAISLVDVAVELDCRDLISAGKAPTTQQNLRLARDTSASMRAPAIPVRLPTLLEGRALSLRKSEC